MVKKEDGNMLLGLKGVVHDLVPDDCIFHFTSYLLTASVPESEPPGQVDQVKFL